jgi:hypothetical protein
MTFETRNKHPGHPIIQLILVQKLSHLLTLQGTHQEIFIDRILPGLGFDKSNPYIDLNYRNRKEEKMPGKNIPPSKASGLFLLHASKLVVKKICVNLRNLWTSDECYLFVFSTI